MKIRKTLALIVSILSAISVCGCSITGKDDSSKAFEGTENVEVSDEVSISKIPDDAEKEIVFFGTYDLNPTEGNAEKSTELQLFESKGGSIKWQSTTDENRFSDLAAPIMANKDVPDIFKYEWLAFPSQTVKGMYQPIDSIVDFDSPLWADSKATADQFVLKGEHYVAPLGYQASAMLCYDKDVITAAGLDDPYELYKSDEWTWSAWQKMMSDYVSAAEGDDERFGVNGFFRTHIVQQTGQKMVDYDSETNSYVNNLDNADIEKAEDFLYDLCKNGLILDGWIGSARECFDQHCLFYAMGEWAYSGDNSPKDGENWGIVPIPEYDDNKQKITTSDMTAYMWVRGSEKSDAVKCWFECCRAAFNQPEYTKANKKKFMSNNPNWTEQMYEVKTDVASEDYLKIFDYAFGLSYRMGNPGSYQGDQSLTEILYNDASTLSEDGSQSTWSQVKRTHSRVVDEELKEVNGILAELNNSDN